MFTLTVNRHIFYWRHTKSQFGVIVEGHHNRGCHERAAAHLTLDYIELSLRELY